MNKWEQWRDPSHVRAYRVSEWQSFLAGAGLRIEKWDMQRKTHAFGEWVERMQMPSAAITALEADMSARQAPSASASVSSKMLVRQGMCPVGRQTS